VLVATDIAARGIDVEALSHVINFDVPNVPEDYIHRVGRTARAEMVGDAFTFVSEGEQEELQAIERAVGSRLPRRMVEGFDYQATPAERFEIPLQERIAAIRARRAEERARAKAKAEKKAQREAEEKARLEEKARRRTEGRPAEPQPRQQHHHQQQQGKQRSGQPRNEGPLPERGNRAAEAPSHLGRQQQPRRKDFQRRGRHPVPEPVVQREVDPTTKPTEERLTQIRSAFSPARFNRFRR
jgi:ATP-dependent RNA helicase RhlE